MRYLLSILLSLSLLLPSLRPMAGAAQPLAGIWPGSLPGQQNADTKDTQPPAGEVAVSAPSVVLMEASTGQTIYEKEPHSSLHPASITKIMTMILIFDALQEGKISLEDTVTVSEYASSMGGSQVFLEPGETQTVDTMLKCISVASANDACVAIRYSRH